MKEKLYKTIQEICTQVLQGGVSLEKFLKVWPHENQDAFLKIVYEDVEDAVEHLPASFITGKVDWKTWVKTDTYKSVYIDNVLLAFWKSDAQRLIECRAITIRKMFTSEIQISGFIKEFMNDGE